MAAVSAPEEPSQVVAAATAPRGSFPPVPEAREADDGTWTDEDLAYCRSKAKEAGDAAASRMLRAVSTDRVGLGGPSETMMERSALLLCNATRKPSHLCQGYWRNQLIETTKAYAQEFRKVSQQMYWTSHNVTERAKRNSKTDWDSVTDDLRQTTREMARMHDEIVSALRARIADGIIDRGDFGVVLGIGIAPDVAKLIGDAKPVRNVCG